MKLSNSYLYILFLFFPFIANATPVIIPDAKLKTVKPLANKVFISSNEFTQNDIQKSPTVNLNQFLNQEQSAAHLTNNSADSNQVVISLRGFGDNAAANSLILVDGFPLTNPSLLAPNFNSIPLSDIERMEIIQGSAGSLWGDQAVGGVINIITKHPNKFLFNGIFSAGSFNSYYENILLADKKTNGIFYKIFATLGKTDHYRQHNRVAGNNIAAQIGNDYARGTIRLQLQFYENTTYFPGGLTEDQFENNPHQATDFRNFNRFQTYLIQLLSKHELNNQWLLETRFDHHSTNGDGFVSANFDRKDSLTSINPKLLGAIGNNKLIAGYLAQASQYRLTNKKGQANTSAWQHDLYFQTIFPITQKLNFVLGARKAWQINHVQPIGVDNNNVLNQVLVTEQSLNFSPIEGLIFFLRRDGNFSFPKANEQTWLPSNLKSLKTQEGTSYETGAKWHAQKYESQFSLYRLILNNEIAFNPQQTLDQPFGSFNNLDKTIRDGVSFGHKYFVTSNFSVDGQLNYVKAQFASGPYAGNSIPAVPRMTANAGLNYALTENLSAHYSVLYTGSRYPSEDLANTSKKIPGYFLHDIALQYFYHSINFNLEILNLFNKNYVNYAYYNTFTRQNVYYPAAGRSYLVTVKLNI